MANYEEVEDQEEEEEEEEETFLDLPNFKDVQVIDLFKGGE